MDSLIGELILLSEDDFASAVSRLLTESKFSLFPNEIKWNRLFDEILNRTLSNNSKSSRSISYGVLSQIMSHKKFLNLHRKLNQLIDRFPSFIESCQTTEELMNLNKLIQVVIHHVIPETSSTIARVLPKIALSLCKLGNFCQYGPSCLSILESLLNSSERNLMLSSISIIRQFISQYLNQRGMQEQVTQVLSLTYVFESTDSWQNAWKLYSSEAVQMIESLGIAINSKEKSSSLVMINHIEGYGISKALTVERYFKGYCLLLSKMLRNGCSCGPVEIDLSDILPLSTTVLSLNFKLDPKDAKISIENENGISLSALSVILVQLKVSCLQLITSLLQSHHPSLPKVGLIICQSLSYVLVSSDMIDAPLLSQAALKCFALALSIFPTILSRHLSLGINNVVEYLQSSMDKLVSIPSDTFNSSNSNSNNSNSNGELSHNFSITDEYIYPDPVQIMKTVEAMILYCGPLLPTNSRESTEQCIWKGLYILSKGVLFRHLPDHHNKRAQVESIRSNSSCQYALLSLALTEILVSKRSGILSGNIPILKKAANCCIQHSETSDLAIKVLLMIDRIIHPSSMVLPSIPLIVEAKNYISNVVKYSEKVTKADTTLSNDHFNVREETDIEKIRDIADQSNGSKRKFDSMIVTSSSSSSSSSSSQRNQDISKNSNNTSTESSSMEFPDKLPNRNIDGSIFNRSKLSSISLIEEEKKKNHIDIVKNNHQEEDDDDNDDIPDINMDSDEDQ